MKHYLFIFFALFTINHYCNAQTHCKDIDLNKQPGKWNWKYQGINRPVAKQIWDICDPISKEFQRIMPQAPDGIIAYSLLNEGGPGTFYNMPKGPRYYDNTFMIKDYECIMYPNAKVQPEGETGCWIYFDVNNHKEYGVKLPGGSDVMYDEHRRLYLTDAWIETDANGNYLLYIRNTPDAVLKLGYFFSAKKQLPYRKISRKELYNCYKLFHEKRVNKEIARFEEIVVKNDQQYNSLTAAQKKEQNYWPDIIKRDKGVLQGYKNEKENIERWYAGIMQQPGINDTAYAQQIASWAFEPKKLNAAPGEGFSVWTDDINYYDKSKLPTQPQYIFLHYRRQDENLPKKNFMDKFCNEFNLDVLNKMIGLAPRKPGGINTINSSIIEAKTVTKTQQESGGPVTISFDNTTDGKFPSGWLGMKNISVQSHNGAKWLAMKQDGYWYPRQYNKEIKDGFKLNFDLTWNPDIDYYSGLFTVTLSEMAYDNAGERYKIDDNQQMYWSFYNSYAGNFNRVILWFDPYWNDGGTLTVYSYDRGENLKFSKRIVLPDFYKEKNKHNIGINRNGDNLLVTDNGEIIADLTGVFQPKVKYNLYTFSRYKGNTSDNKDDVFYVKDIKIAY